MKYIVYQTINTNNNKIYVGVHKTLNPEVFDGYIGCGVYVNRASSYMDPYTPFQYAVKKYGPGAFKRTTLKIFDTLEEAFELEKSIVNYEFLKRKDTYNAALGGGGGNQVFVPVYQFDMEGKFIKKWNSMIEASEAMGVWHNAILRATSEKGSCKGFLWSKTEIINLEEYKFIQRTTCYKYDSETGKCVGIYYSVPEAASGENCQQSSIQRALKGGYKVGNYYFSTKLMEEYKGGTKVSLKNKTLYVYNLEGSYLTELKGSSEICNYFGIKSTNVITTSIRVGRPYKDYQFSFEKLESLQPVINKRNINKRVGKYSLEGELLEEFDSIEKAFNIYGSGVKKCIKSSQRQCKGFIFKLIS